MLLIQAEGTPTAAAAPASTPKTRRRVMGTGGVNEPKGWEACGLIWCRPRHMKPASVFRLAPSLSDYRAIFFTQIGSPCGTLLQSQSGPKPVVVAATKAGNRM